MAQRNVQDEGLFPGVDLLAMAIQAEKQEKAEKQQRQEMYLQGLQLRRQQEASALAAQREARIANENQRKADYRTQIDVENLKTNRARLNLDERRLSWDREKTQTELIFKTIADARNRMQRRADMMQTLNMQMYAKVLNFKNPQEGFADAKKSLERTKNTFAAVQSAIQWWDRNPATRRTVLSDPNNPQFNQMWEIPGVKKAFEGLDNNQRGIVERKLTQYASLPEDQRATFLSQLKEDEETATAMTQTYSGFQDPKEAVKFVEAVINKTNADVNEIYARMPSFNGVNPQQIFQQYEQTQGEAKSIGDASSYGASAGVAYGSPSAPSQQTDPASPVNNSTTAQEEPSEGTNEEGYYEEPESDAENGSQTNESGYYDDEEDG